LLIELRGDRYVQISSSGTEADEHSRQSDYFREMAGGAGAKSVRSQADVGKTNVLSSRPRVSRGQGHTKNALAAGVLRHELAPTVLVYRDGRREEVREYSIADGVLYARGDYYAVGYWNKKIELVTLDLPQTMKANQERGVSLYSRLAQSCCYELVTRASALVRQPRTKPSKRTTAAPVCFESQPLSGEAVNESGSEIVTPSHPISPVAWYNFYQTNGQ